MKMEIKPEQPASVTLLGLHGSATPITARITSTSVGTITIVCNLAAPLGSAVKIQWAQFLVLGEIVSRQEATQTIVLRIRHALNTDQVEQIRQKWV
jgi:hypothetical protein